MIPAHIIHLIEAELERARTKFPSWPDDIVYQAAIIAEEAGEVVQVALNLREDDPHAKETTNADWVTELVQTAAMAIRALEGR